MAKFYNSKGEPTKKLYFVELDMNVDDVKDTKYYKKLMGKWSNSLGWENKNCFIGCAIPLEYYEEVCKAISKITKKAYKEGFYYGAPKHG